jgi:Integrase core domain
LILISRLILQEGGVLAVAFLCFEVCFWAMRDCSMGTLAVGKAMSKPQDDRPKDLLFPARWAPSRDHPHLERRVAHELTAIVEWDDYVRSWHGVYPAMLRLPERAVIDGHFIAPGKPIRDGFIESFSGRMCDELLSETLFFDLYDVRTRSPKGRRLQYSSASLVVEIPNSCGSRRPHRKTVSCTWRKKLPDSNRH